MGVPGFLADPSWALGARTATGSVEVNQVQRAADPMLGAPDRFLCLAVAPPGRPHPSRIRSWYNQVDGGKRYDYRDDGTK